MDSSKKTMNERVDEWALTHLLAIAGILLLIIVIPLIVLSSNHSVQVEGVIIGLIVMIFFMFWIKAWKTIVLISLSFYAIALSTGLIYYTVEDPNRSLTPQEIQSNKYWDCVAEGACEPPENDGQSTP